MTANGIALAIAISVVGASLTYHWLESAARAWRPSPGGVFLVMLPILGLVGLWIALLMGPLEGRLYCGNGNMGRALLYRKELADQTTPAQTLGACLDGSPPAYYWRRRRRIWTRTVCMLRSFAAHVRVHMRGWLR